MKTQFSILISSLGAAALFSGIALAETDITPEVAADKPVGETVITATKTPVKVQRVMAAVTVIDAEQIDRSGAADIADVLESQPGLSVVRTGGKNGAVSVFMRGTESDHVVVVIDGVKQNTATLSAINWSDININNIERIEIVRGPKAALYGSEAIGGVVQIFTRDSKGGQIALSAGSYASQSAHARVAGGGENFKLGAHAQLERESGFSDYDETSGPNYVGQEDADGSQGGEYGAFAQLYLGATELSLKHSRGKKSIEIDGSTPEFQTENDTTALSINSEFDQLALAVVLSDNDQTSGDYSSEQKVANLQADFDFDKGGLLTVGAAYEDRFGKSVNGFDSFAEGFVEKAGFVQWQGDFDGLQTTAAARYVDDSKFGSHTTSNVGFGVLVSDWTAYASYGTGYKAPTLSELYSAFPALPQFSSGNPNLKPEESETVEIGVKGQLEGVNVSWVAYRSELENLIDFAFINGSFNYHNVKESKITGSTLSLTGELADRWDWAFNYSWLRAKDGDSNRLKRRPSKKLNLRAAYQWEAATSEVEVLAVGRRTDTSNADFSTIELPGYVVLNLQQQFQIDSRNELIVDVENALDTDYNRVHGFGTGGRIYTVKWNHEFNW